ncbi:restriction endonuclease [Rhizobium leguminosarum]|uniref:restriction endonuclease n=1 Tax=Rhizobium leguminosarum TaxID=384 RepID=UPI003F96B3EA
MRARYLTAKTTDCHSCGMMYDFSNLSHPDFEDLARDLVGRELNLRFESFPEGPDGGIDGRHAMADGAIVLQAKHYHRSGFATLKSKMGKERAAIDRLQAKRYILVTSAPLTHKNKAALAAVIGPSLQGPGDIFGPGDLNALLRKHPDVEKAHQKLWARSTMVLETVVGDAVVKALDKPGTVPSSAEVLQSILDRTYKDVSAKVSSAHLALKFDPTVYVKRLLEDDIEDWFAAAQAKSSTCFLVLAPAGSGKTNLLCRLAKASSLVRPTVLLIGSQLRIDSNYGIWTQVFEACGISALANQSRSDRVGVVKELARHSRAGFVIVLDAINEHSDPVSLRRELSMFLAECEQSGIRLLVSCRDYYWGLFDANWWGLFIRSHHDERKSTRRVLGNFSPEEAGHAFKLYFEHYEVSTQPLGNALEQFRHPLLLRFFCETYRGESLGRLRDIRLKDLFDTYWERKLGSIAERMIDQGTIGVLPELKRSVAKCILDIATHMLANNVRAIPVLTAQQLSLSDTLPSQLPASYGRILDEHIVLEELDPWGTNETTLVAFVFEEFMEYAMARSMLAQWRAMDLNEIYAGVVTITERYNDFSQVLGVVLYLALMLKEKRDIALWSTLIDRGPQWEKVIIEAFKKLPENQIDDGVFEALVDLLRAPHPSTQIEALELLKYGRLRRVPTPNLVAAVGELVTSNDLRIRRRALLALGSCPADFAIPLIERAITTPIHKMTHAYEVAKNAATSLVKLNTEDALPVIALMCGGFWHADNIGEIIAPYISANLAAVYDLLASDNVVLRLGAVRMLGHVLSRETLTNLESVVANLRAQPPTWSYKDLPDWVRVSGGHFLFADLKIDGRDGEHVEIASALTVIQKLKMQLGWKERKEALHRFVDDLIKDSDSCRLHDAIATLEYDSEAVVKLLQAGLEMRDPNKWKVHKGRWGILIVPRGKKRAECSLEERRDLARLLRLEEGKIRSEGATIGVGGSSYDYWKEYIYRCWGWDPVIKGYFDHWD